ncbi:hypothetical protein BB560_001077 [Smittium megazygosporum]|uniref:SET domain-containing protein n=1 Tax=Smittium megazygosporum TaxID=133381 RepID=A0A2T9ZIU1_9FUNG|nr:hypothetical protein BB560_001077 [Smittium megazygosporum]
MSDGIESRKLRQKRNTRIVEDGFLYGSFAMEYLDEYLFHEKHNNSKKSYSNSKKKKASSTLDTKSIKSVTIAMPSISGIQHPNTKPEEQADHRELLSDGTQSIEKGPSLATYSEVSTVSADSLNGHIEPCTAHSNNNTFEATESDNFGENAAKNITPSAGLGALTPVSRPRWYNQNYIIFLALRECENYTATRKTLLKKALDLDRKFSKELSVPRVFTGKTPLNSASSRLTKNEEKYFIQTKPENSKHKQPVPTSEDMPTEGPSSLNKDTLISNSHDAENANEQASLNKTIQGTHDSLASEPNHPKIISSSKQITEYKDSEMPRFYSMVAKKFIGAPGSNNESLTNLEIPKSWRDIVTVKKSTIPNAGKGLFAKRFIPAGIPLGFYFGVPMTEYEFDSLKDRVGMASHYSIMYRRTVLDATNDHGMPFTQMNGPLFCPFHFMNDDRENKKYNITFVDGEIVNQVICYSTKDIFEGEELFVYYGPEVDREQWGLDTANSENKEQDLLCI